MRNVGRWQLQTTISCALQPAPDWVRCFFADDMPLTIVGTELEVVDNRLTGRFKTHNCYGAEKVRRLEAVLSEPRSNYHIVAYGDSRGDKELLAYAYEGYYKPFEKFNE